MNKNILKVAFVAAVALVSGINVFNTQKSETLSEIATANVEALAAFVMNPVDCNFMIDRECGVLVVTPEGSYGEIYYNQINKS